MKLSFTHFVVFLVVVCSSSQALAQQPNKIAYADLNYIMEKMPDSQELKAKLEEVHGNLQSEFTTKQAQFEKQLNDYQINQGKMADTTRLRIENQLRALNDELQQFQGNAQQTIDNTKNLYMSSMYLKIGNAIRSVATENGYSMILTKNFNQTPFLVYSDKKDDVSDLVLKKLAPPTEPPKK